LDDNLQMIKCIWVDQGGVLQNVSHVINPNWWQLLPKGRTPWGPCVLHYIYIYLCNKESILCHLSLLFSILPLSTAIDHNRKQQFADGDRESEGRQRQDRRSLFVCAACLHPSLIHRESCSYRHESGNPNC
jgi:hypothetical protein